MKFSFQFGDWTNEDFDIEVIKRPTIPLPIKKYKEIEVEGSNGNYYIDTEAYENIEFFIDCNFIECDLDYTREQFRSIQNWLNESIEEDNRLILSDDFEYFYKVKKVEISNISYENVYEIQSFQINFTVEGLKYWINTREVQLNSTYRNRGIITKPIYRITGTGNCNFVINGITVNCTNITNGLIIDVKNNKILNADGTRAIGKTNIKNMKLLYLKKGINNFSWSNGFNVYIKPNIKVLG
nr:MAG TPA: distal tail protein [Caudoviricetes sp.]